MINESDKKVLLELLVD